MKKALFRILIASLRYTGVPAGAYTAVGRGKNGTTGVALVEVYVLQ
jgi:hypothetical protein